MQSEFSKRVKARREELGLTQEELASEIGISAANVSQFEGDVRKPSFQTLLKLSNALFVSTDFLIGIKHEPDFRDLLADNKISEMMLGFVTLPEEQKSQLFRMYQGLAALYRLEKHERDTSTGQ